MKKYDTYKDSGNQWIGQVPEHWKILPIKYCAELFTGNSISDRDKENYLDSTDAIPYIATKDINAQTLLTDYENGMYTKKEDASFKIASKGSTLLCIEGGSAGRKKTYLTEDVSFVNKLCCFTAKENMSGKYLYYYINSNEFVETFNNHITGLIGGVSLSSLVNFKSPLPPLSEQQAIVEFLDKKTGKIDQSIALLETQKTDLRAYRQALITETVTKGLNPSAPMKDSGIQWIGEIPEHWKIKKSSYIFDIIGSGTTPKSDNTAYYIEDGEFWLQTGDLNDGLITNTTKRISSLAFQDYNLQKYPIGSIVIAMYGATIGKLGLLGIPTATNQACCVLYADEKVQSNKYSFYLFSAAKREIINSANGGGQPNISQQIIRDFRLPTPPLSEQQAIADYLDKKTNDIDAALMQIDTQIADLQAYRTALISEAVTGKIDVRNQ